jgi:hypothetical protein
VISTYLKIVKISLLIIISLQQFTFADSYCFPKDVSLYQAKKEIAEILLPGEEVLIDARGHCIEVFPRDYRVALIDKFMKQRFKLNSSNVRAQIPRGMCKFSFKTEYNRQANTNKVELGSKNDIENKKEVDQKTTVAEFAMSEGRNGRFKMGEGHIIAKCFRRANSYEVEFTVDEAKSYGVSITLDMYPGVWQDLGSVRKDLLSRINKKSLRDGVRYKVTTGEEIAKYSLMVRK